MNVVFAPGVALFNRLRYPHKFLFIGTLFLVPLLILGYLLIQEVNQRIAFMAQQQPGIEYISQLRKIIQPMQQHRGMSAAILGGSNELHSELKKQKAIIDQAFINLQQLDVLHGSRLKTGDRFSKLQREWIALERNLQGYTQLQSFQNHTALIDNMLDFIRYLANTSNLILASKMDTYYLIDALVSHLPKLTEDLGQSRALGSAIIVEGRFTSERWQQLLGATQRINEAEKNLVRGMQAVLEENPSLTHQLQTLSDKQLHATNSYNNGLIAMLKKDQVTINLETFFNQATQTIDNVFALFDSIVPAIDGLLTERIADYKMVRGFTMAIMVLVLVAMIYSFISFYLSVMSAITELKSGIEQLATGDLTVSIVLAARDETQLIAKQANAMAQQFRTLVKKVMLSTQQVATAAEQLAAASAQTNQGIDEQRSQTDQVATAMNQMSSTVHEVARSAAATSNATHSVQQEVSTGNQVVHNTVQVINALATEIQAAAVLVHQLGEDSNDIGHVVDVIRGISEQTNLLALNAAIEAARAGEQGRGFAVVADEVRTLAGRTQQSTQEIQQMIEQLQAGAQKAMDAMQSSETRIKEGVVMVERAGTNLTSIHDSVTTITDMSAQIASAAEQQSAVAEEINTNIIEIAQVSDQNASASNQTATSSIELSRLSNELKQMVAVFST